jgi:ApbE superfamily uncharacterized protein (UPF0280 family)
VSASRNLERETRDLVTQCRRQIEAYIEIHPEFSTSLLPHPPDPFAPPVVREMIRVTRQVGVGPMAAVAGAVAAYVGEGLLACVDQVIVENGGDLFLKMNRDAVVRVLAGRSGIGENLGLRIRAGQTPLGIGSSSATVGHSLSLGAADLVCLLSPSAALADGAATALGNRLSGPGDVDRATAWARAIPGVIGGLVILGDRVTCWGDVELAGV